MKKLNEIFNVAYGNKFDLNKMTPQPRSQGGVSFVGRSEKNLGVSATVAKVAGIDPYPAGLITVALGGAKLLSSYIQPFPFYTAQNVAVLQPLVELSFEEMIYACECIKTNRFRYEAFGREANRTLRTLPIPDIKQDRPIWLDELGSMTNAIEPALQEVRSFSDESIEPKPSAQSNGLISLSDIFDVRYGHSLELNKLTFDRDGVNFVSRTSYNNGISARVKRVADVAPIEGGVLTVALGGSVLETFYQAEPFYSGYHIQYLVPKIDLTPEEMLYYAICIRANRYRYSYGRQANRTLRDLLVPGYGLIPSWVYGAGQRVATALN